MLLDSDYAPSVFGTNLGDFYAHERGLGIVKGLAVLALLAGVLLAGRGRAAQIITKIALVAVLVIWRSRAKEAPALVESALGAM